MRATRHDVLFEPLTIGSKTFRNRFYAVPHAYFPLGRRLSDIAFRRTKAEGGWAAVCSGIISIREDNWDGCLPRLWDEVDRAALTRMAVEVRGQGALAGIELGHNGAIFEGGKFDPSIGATQIADPEQPQLVPKAMDLDDIRRLQNDWAASAGQAAEIGYDIVYAYGGAGYLPAQFLSPYFNKRRDAYGGSLENRSRFWLESLERFRAAVGDRCIVAVRIAAEALNPLGISADETLNFVRLADDLVDLWDVNVGFRWYPDSAPSRLAPEGYQLEWSGRVREATSKPIVGVGRLTNPDRMAEIIASGTWDLIGAARPSIADPFLPRKIEEGRYDEIRECTGANFCIAKERFTAGLSCVQNPTIGEEYRRRWHPERFAPVAGQALDALVVGAGPAGLECARVLGHRGLRRVHLVDAQADIGGHLQWLTQLPGLGEWARIVNYRKVQLAALANVEVILRTKLEAGDVLAYGAEIVVLATGSRWLAPDEWDGLPFEELKAANIPVLTPEQIVTRDRAPEGRIVVWDRDGTAVAPSLAERLAVEGRAVTIASAFDQVSPTLDATFEGQGTRRRLHELGVVQRRNLQLVGAGQGELHFTGEFGKSESIATDALVLVVQRLSEDRLYRAIRDDSTSLETHGIRGLHRIGDCIAPRELGYVIADGHRLAREIDRDDPGNPWRPPREDDTRSATVSFESNLVDQKVVI